MTTIEEDHDNIASPWQIRMATKTNLPVATSALPVTGVPDGGMAVISGPTLSGRCVWVAMAIAKPTVSLRAPPGGDGHDCSQQLWRATTDHDHETASGTNQLRVASAQHPSTCTNTYSPANLPAMKDKLGTPRTCLIKGIDIVGVLHP
ncbi:hypothetical protein WOLCODRAFT_161398 [Wolfiporia cocos MD-104 SS10]|uniref:Uncharacterized protein n=1 Tax=Wolfiporia cocos (strain MD-104) TaxID=742152 RepID=A0A2H3JQD5_WOLCO|nr:hypothetical protein WOLCODRAFT_161398 [Wolfiporia cocos MD-104 SS10]